MSKRLRNLKFLNQQVLAVVSHEEQKVRAEGLQLLCSVTNCNKWSCEECPVQRESVKPENERDGVIIGWNPGTVGTEFEGMVGSVIVEFVDGSKASCSGMDLPTRRDMTEHFVSKYLGKIAEVHYMQRDSRGGYRHPNFYRLHPDKTDIAQCD